jgi:hypothetical protein
MLSTINGSGKRALESWIDRFVDHTKHVETPTIFRKWAGIATIAAALEQKVWITTSSPMYPNLYTGMIAQPGVGKTRIIAESAKLLLKLPDPYIAPTSINSSSLVDHLVDCKRTIINMPHAPLEYNSMVILADELGTFMSEYDDGLVAELTSFYDVTALPYGQRRRGNQLKIKIEKPQLNILFGSTPSNLMKFMPEGAWSQGFASRIIFIYSDEKNVIDDFSGDTPDAPEDLIHDLKIINTLAGKFGVTEDYRNAVNNWRALGEPPKPTHPRLLHYCTRRKAHLYRLSMISAIDRGNALILDKADFNRAMGWLLEAELDMAKIFKGQVEASASNAMEDIAHFISTKGEILETVVIRFAGERVRTHEILPMIEIMLKSGMIEATAKDRRTGMRLFRVPGSVDRPSEPQQHVLP